MNAHFVTAMSPGYEDDVLMMSDRGADWEADAWQHMRELLVCLSINFLYDIH